MILKSLILNNIRSYGKETEIKFTKGSSLFEGDIGSGKSTILLAIEFALFGLGDIEGSHLLRIGKKQGWVKLQFEVESKEYTIFRSLVRKPKGVSQKEGYIIEDGERTDYSITELKSRVLKILDFKEREHPRTSSIIYRYAVFTPQEMMKEVLLQKPDKRIETLRKAFGIEEYSTARENSIIVEEEIRTETRIIGEATKDLDELKENLKNEIEDRRNTEVELKDARKEADKTSRFLSEINDKIEELTPKKEKMLELRREIPLLTDELKDKMDQGKDLQKRIKRHQDDLDEIEEAIRQVQDLEPVYHYYIEKKDRIRVLERSIEEFRNQNVRKVRLEERIQKEEKHLKKEFEQIERQKDQLQQKIDVENKEIEKIEELEHQKSQINEETRSLQRIEKETQEISSQISKERTLIETKNHDLESKKNELEDINRIGVGAPCPRCKQALSTEHYKIVETKFKEEIDTIEKSLEKISMEVESLVTQEVKLEKEKIQLEEKEDELKKIIQILAKLREKEHHIELDKNELDDLQKELDHKKNLIENNDFALEDRKELQKVLDSLIALEDAKKEYEDLKKSIDQLEEEDVQSRYMRSKEKTLRKPRVEKELDDSTRTREELLQQIQRRREEIDDKTEIYEKGRDVLTEIDTLEKRKTETNFQFTKVEKRVSSLTERATLLDKQIKKIEESVEEKERKLVRKDALEQIKIWIKEHFVPALQDIEVHVLTSIKEEFDRLFQYWFNSLIETDEISVRIDDNFTPIIEQGGYELDLGSLSGGERTTVALAYRLALNIIVKKECRAMKTNLLILDEPTDGFSKEQLNKLRDVLRELDCEQIIMVSHEKELEVFVDRVYYITKEGGISRVQLISAE